MASFDDSTLRAGARPVSEESFEWLNGSILSATGKTPANAVLVDFSGMGGLSAQMRRLVVTFEDGTEQKFVWKTVGEANLGRSKDLGLAREALFFEHLAPTLSNRGVPLPNVIYLHGDMETGEKTIILEDLSSQCVQSGYFFGAGSPHNWGKDLAAVVAANRPAGANEKISMKDITRAAFRTAASIHATYWMDKSLLQHRWLRSQDWIQGQGRESWQAAQDHASSLWAKTLQKVSAGTSGVKWDAHLLRCMDASFAKISWEAYQAQVQSAEYQWTLVHGDFHPANILWRWPAAAAATEATAQGLGTPVLLDFEVVGLGSGAQDLAQYLISHASPEDRRGCEQELLRDYYAHLTGTATAKEDSCCASKAGSCCDVAKACACNCTDCQGCGTTACPCPCCSAGTCGAPAPAPRVDPARYTLAQCEADYVAGGVGRWVWLLALLSGMCPDPMTQFFHDQVHSFIVDHGVTPENIAMPRV